MNQQNHTQHQCNIYTN